MRGQETIGTLGNATAAGLTLYAKDKLSLSGDYSRSNNYATKDSIDTASVSATAQLSRETEVHSTFGLTDSVRGDQSSSVAVGTTSRVNDELEVSSDNSFAFSKENKRYGNTVGFVRERDKMRLEGTVTREYAEGPAEKSTTNILGLSGEINDRWAAYGSFEVGDVQNHDGSETQRYAGSLGVGFVDRDEDTGESRFKASSKIEVRFDQGEQEKRQLSTYNAVEGKITPAVTLFGKAHLSQTDNLSTGRTEAKYKELVFGGAYRPIAVDWLNMLLKYTFLEDYSPGSQTDIHDVERERSHTIAGEAVVDIGEKWQVTGKLAYKIGEEQVAGFDPTLTQTLLCITRLGYNITEDWQVAGEYRLLKQLQAQDMKHGALVEVSRDLGDYLQVGAGYNFTQFNDDLTHLDYTSHGPFIRITGKLYDRSDREKGRVRAKRNRQEPLVAVEEVEEQPQSEGAFPDYPREQELVEMNGRIARIDMSRGPEALETTTVYHGAGFEEQAQSFADRLGANTVVKPLDWASTFDLIAMIGKKSGAEGSGVDSAESEEPGQELELRVLIEGGDLDCAQLVGEKLGEMGCKLAKIDMTRGSEELKTTTVYRVPSVSVRG